MAIVVYGHKSAKIMSPNEHLGSFLNTLYVEIISVNEKLVLLRNLTKIPC